jgi:hypothetical protein
MACATIFDRDLNLMKNVSPRFEGDIYQLSVSFDYVIMKINDMLCSFWGIMRIKKFGSDKSIVIDMTDYANWYPEWQWATNIFEISRESFNSWQYLRIVTDFNKIDTPKSRASNADPTGKPAPTVVKQGYQGT